MWIWKLQVFVRVSLLGTDMLINCQVKTVFSIPIVIWAFICHKTNVCCGCWLVWYMFFCPWVSSYSDIGCIHVRHADRDSIMFYGGAVIIIAIFILPAHGGKSGGQSLSHQLTSSQGDYHADNMQGVSEKLVLYHYAQCKVSHRNLFYILIQSAY